MLKPQIKKNNPRLAAFEAGYLGLKVKKKDLKTNQILIFASL
jgi:hypothetical protein